MNLPDQKERKMTLPRISMSPEMREIRSRVVQLVLNIGAIVTTPIYFINLFGAVRNGNAFEIISYTIFYVIFLAAAFFRFISVEIRSMIVITLFMALGLMETFTNGMIGAGRPVMIGFIFLSVFLINRRTGVIAFTISIIALTLAGWGMTSGWLPQPALELGLGSRDGLQWVSDILLFIMVAGSAAAGLSIFLQDQTVSNIKQKNLATDLEIERNSLESNVNARTTELQKKTAQLEAAMLSARDIASIQDSSLLLQSAVELICKYFNFYHAGIFLIDDQKEYAVLKAATGEAGRAMLNRSHRLKIGSEGIVGYVVARGIPRVALNVGEDTAHFKNPLLPETRSEVALPLQIGGTVIGALDVQSKEENAFLSDDLKVMQSIADQLAVAIDKSQLVESLRKQIATLENNYSTFTKQSWRYHLKKRERHFAYRSDKVNTITQFSQNPEAERAIQNNQMILSTYEENQEDLSSSKAALAVPIRLRDQVLGVINLRFEGQTISKEMIDLIETTSGRLAVALDNVRLLEDIRDRSERDRFVADITSKIRSSTEVEKILETTAQQLGQKLGVKEVHVQLKTSES
ncbi:MAG: GAF domain-containing protein [Anaerolineaceae bacterium]|nr:GAF domain-containing protein [Anaerolineaceae bacterium]